MCMFALEKSDSLAELLALDDDLSLLCSIVVWLDVDMPVVGGFGALGLRVTHLCPKCNSHREAGMPNVHTKSILMW